LNLLLLRDDDFAADGSVHLGGRRLEHARSVLRVAAGDTVRVGRLNGALGTARVLAVSPAEIVLMPPQLDQPPPPRAAIDLLLALPRPKTLRKVLPAVAALGVDRVVLVNAARVEKSYFTSDLLSAARVDELLALGLEQARDTVPPQVLVRRRFRPFVEDELEELLGRDPLRLVAHPDAAQALPARPPGRRVALAVGPEGGWVAFELELLGAHGFLPVHLGARRLRVESAIPALVGALR
jgi:RsmE family RNA methyltransferase